MGREHRFGTGIAQGTIPSGFPVFWVVVMDVPGTPTEQVRTCGFRRNSPSLDKAPKIREPVRLNSFENFLVTRSSISSEIWEMYSWAISGSSVFCERLFLVFSGVSLETAANFFFFLKVAIVPRENFCQLWRLNWKFHFYSGKINCPTGS